MGVNNAELWNNLALSCFYAAQYDMALNCFERALSISSDDTMADIWYNVGHVGVALGDLGLAYQAFKVALSVDPNHSEALNNIAVLEIRRLKPELARNCLSTSIQVGPHLYEPLYNSGKCIQSLASYLTMWLALMAFRSGEFQDAFSLVCKALAIYPNHQDSKELKENLDKFFTLQ